MLQVFQPFDLFFTLFTVVFVVVLIVIILSVVANFIRIFRKPSGIESVEKDEKPVVREREIIREIIKIRCPYCNNLYDEKHDKCPYCGGKRKP